MATTRKMLNCIQFLEERNQHLDTRDISALFQTQRFRDSMTYPKPHCFFKEVCCSLNPADVDTSCATLGCEHPAPSHGRGAPSLLSVNFCRGSFFMLHSQAQGRLYYRALNSAAPFLAVKRKKMWSFIPFTLKGLNHLSQN